MKKFLTWILGGLLSLALCGCALFGDYASTIEKNWGIVLPKESGYKQVYAMQTEASFHGDGFRYHVFACADGQAMLAAFSWSSEEKSTNFHDSFTASCEGWLDEIGVPQNERPVYGECVYYYDSQQDLSEMIMLYSGTQSKLYVVESFL